MSIRTYIDDLSLITFLMPFLSQPRGFFNDMHNQFLEVFISTGLIGVFFFYGLITVKLKVIGHNYPEIGFSLILIIFIGGLVVNTTMHPYLSVCFAYIIAFYYRLSVIQRENKA